MTMDTKNDLTLFKLQIFKYTLIVAIIFGIGSLPFLGVSIPYLYGLFLGTCIAIVCFNVLVFVSQKMLSKRKSWLAPLGYLVRLPIYGAAFLFSYKGYGLTSGIACIIGFMTVQIAIIFVHGIKAKYFKKQI